MESSPKACCCCRCREVKTEPSTSDSPPTEHVKKSGQWKEIYAIPPKIPGKKPGKPVRGYCFTKSSSTGVERWIVDLRQPVHHWLDSHTGQACTFCQTSCLPS